MLLGGQAKKAKQQVGGGPGPCEGGMCVARVLEKRYSLKRCEQNVFITRAEGGRARKKRGGGGVQRPGLTQGTMGGVK